MDDLARAALLGLLQGLTEFLPVSSSGHLVLVPALFKWPAPGLTFDAVVHGGTALALIAYFLSDWRRMAGSAVRSLKGRNSADDPDRRLILLLAFGSLPAIVAGLLLQDWFESLFDAPRVAAAMLLVTGTLLFVAERVGRGVDEASDLRARGSLLVGCAQAAAIVPGISRSGATISAGQMLGLTRHSATRFSFLLAAPVTAGAAILRFAELVRTSPTGDSYAVLAVGFVAAFASGFWSIGWLLRYVRRAPLYAFGAYVWLVGLAALWLLP